MDFGCEVYMKHSGSNSGCRRSQFSSQVLTRPPFYSKLLVGVGPYVDWLEEVTDWKVDLVASSAQIPALYVGEHASHPKAPLTRWPQPPPAVDPSMPGGMTSKQLKLTVATPNFSPSQAAFITEVASTLSSSSYTVQEKYVFITSDTVSGSSTTLTVQVVGQRIEEARITALQAKTTLGGLTVSSFVAT